MKIEAIIQNDSARQFILGKMDYIICSSHLEEVVPFNAINT